MRLTTFNLATLCIISRAPRSGYDIRREFGSTPVGPFTDSPGAIYPALKKLEENGLISGRVDGDGTLRPRRLFRLTSLGKRKLRERLRQPITRRDVIWHLDDLMIRFVYAEEILGAGAALALLKGFQAEVKGHTDDMAAYARKTGPELTPMARLALENGVESYRQQLRWATRAVRELESVEQENK